MIRADKEVAHIRLEHYEILYNAICNWYKIKQETHAKKTDQLSQNHDLEIKRH